MKNKDGDREIKKEIEKSKDSCTDKDCPYHGNLRIRGRLFKGIVIKKFPRRVTVVFDRTIYVKKYERYKKAKTKLHARLPICLNSQINVGDYVEVSECRPLSKIVSFVLVRKIK